MDETHYETRESMTWNQSADLDFEAARAEWERQGEGAMTPQCEYGRLDPSRVRCPHLASHRVTLTTLPDHLLCDEHADGVAARLAAGKLRGVEMRALATKGGE
jgi:hypothetical protein